MPEDNKVEPNQEQISEPKVALDEDFKNKLKEEIKVELKEEMLNKHYHRHFYKYRGFKFLKLVLVLFLGFLIGLLAGHEGHHNGMMERGGFNQYRMMGGFEQGQNFSGNSSVANPQGYHLIYLNSGTQKQVNAPTQTAPANASTPVQAEQSNAATLAPDQQGN